MRLRRRRVNARAHLQCIRHLHGCRISIALPLAFFATLYSLSHLTFHASYRWVGASVYAYRKIGVCGDAHTIGLTYASDETALVAVETG